jgi:hypothetical protein
VILTDKQDVRWCLNILTVCSVLLFVAMAGMLGWTNYRCRTDSTYRPSFETTVGGTEWTLYGSPSGLGARIMHYTEPVAVTEAMTVEQWKTWSLGFLEREPLHQLAGFSLLVRGTLSRTDHDPAGTFTGYDIGWWRALFVPAWAALAGPALLPLVQLVRWIRRRRQAALAAFEVAPPLRRAA